MQTQPDNILSYQSEVIEKITADPASIFWNSGQNLLKTPKIDPN
jgi:hypothetical protein